MSNIPHLLVHDHEDNVGVVVVEGLTAGTEMFCCVTHDNSTFTLTAGADVPIGHKIALKDLNDGDTAIKYGQQLQNSGNKNQVDLFSIGDEQSSLIKIPELKNIEDWDEKRSLLFEKEVLGMYAVSYTHLTLPTKRIV